MVQANMNKGDTMKQVKVCNANGGKNSQGGRAIEVSKGGKANFKKINTPK